MDIPNDIWGQIALEANQMYLADGTKRSPFADTVFKNNFFFSLLIFYFVRTCDNELIDFFYFTIADNRKTS